MNSNPKMITIATRKSELALWQSHFIKQQLLTRFPDLTIQFLPLTTEGDQKLNIALNKVGGKGLFVKALEEALLDGRADLAVHSVKDMPAKLPYGLTLTVVSRREDSRDVLLARSPTSLTALPNGTVVGTSSLRRICQLKALNPALEFKLLRGNVGTRVQKMLAGEYDVIVLAYAGVKRLSLTDHIVDYLPVNQVIPAVGQGALAVEYRQDDTQIAEMIAPLVDEKTHQCVLAERSMNQVLNGGCQVPIAGHAVIHHDQLHLSGLVGSVKTGALIRAQTQGNPDDALNMGEQVAKDLFAQGAQQFLQEIKK